ncbi:MAG TPA: Rrf2 family transcriptional regulator [Treponema sp.]|nr:Rrf2 family transcriptional regulator [Treponema sp.]
MKISTRGRYGVRLLIDLAEHHDVPHIPLAQIAERQHVSARYLEQVAVILKRAGYIRSIKGASGGYALARNPADIIIGEVLRTLEGDMLVVDDLRSGEEETLLKRCLRATVYSCLNERISAVIDSLSLATMVGSRDVDDAPMYYI